MVEEIIVQTCFVDCNFAELVFNTMPYRPYVK